jgi:DNA-binding MarR family transcriptional regulator
MKTIEQEIKQNKFSDIYVKSDINILFTAGWIEGKQMRLFKKYGLSQQQYNVLRILRGQHPQPVMLSQITERMIDKMSNATRLVDKLNKKELTTRRNNPNNRRQVEIHITEKGLELLKVIDTVLEEQTPPAHYSKITVKELNQLNLILDKIRN